MAANARPVEIAEAPPNDRARRSAGWEAAGAGVVVMSAGPSLVEEDEERHGVETHHVLGATPRGDRALHVVGRRVRVAPEDLGQVEAVAAHDQVRYAVQPARHRP